MADKKKKTHHITAKTGKPPGMNYADFLLWKNMIYEEAKKAAISETQRVLADRQAQRMSWLYIVALNEGSKFGFDAKCTEELENTVREMAEEYKRNVEENDQDYADEDLRKRVSQVLNREVKYLYEDQYPINMDKANSPIANLRESESRIY